MPCRTSALWPQLGQRCSASSAQNWNSAKNKTFAWLRALWLYFVFLFCFHFVVVLFQFLCKLSVVGIFFSFTFNLILFLVLSWTASSLTFVWGCCAFLVSQGYYKKRAWKTREREIERESINRSTIIKLYGIYLSFINCRGEFCS